MIAFMAVVAISAIVVTLVTLVNFEIVFIASFTFLGNLNSFLLY